MKRLLFLLFLSATSLVNAAAPRTESPSPDDLAFFENKIRPLLVDHCYSCHSAKSNKKKGGLSLDSRQGVLTGGDSGPAIVIGDPDKSLLIRAIRHTDNDLRMPPQKQLSAAQIADLISWLHRSVERRAGRSTP